MRKSDILYKICSCVLILSLCTMTGCSKESSSLNDKQSMEMQESEEIAQMEEAATEGITQVEEPSTEEITSIEESSTTDDAQKETC